MQFNHFGLCPRQLGKGNANVWKVGGKVFAIGGWGQRDYPGITFKVTPLSFEILQEQPGLQESNIGQNR